MYFFLFLDILYNLVESRCLHISWIFVRYLNIEWIVFLIMLGVVVQILVRSNQKQRSLNFGRSTAIKRLHDRVGLPYSLYSIKPSEKNRITCFENPNSLVESRCKIESIESVVTFVFGPINASLPFLYILVASRFEDIINFLFL